MAGLLLQVLHWRDDDDDEDAFLIAYSSATSCTPRGTTCYLHRSIKHYLFVSRKWRPTAEPAAAPPPVLLLPLWRRHIDDTDCIASGRIIHFIFPMKATTTTTTTTTIKSIFCTILLSESSWHFFVQNSLKRSADQQRAAASIVCTLLLYKYTACAGRRQKEEYPPPPNNKQSCAADALCIRTRDETMNHGWRISSRSDRIGPRTTPATTTNKND